MKPAKNNDITLWAILFWLIVWEAFSLAIGWDIILVSPVRVLMRLTELVRVPAFYLAVLHSLIRITGGFLLAFISGTLLAALSARFLRVRQLLQPAMLTIRSVPVASFIVLSLILFSTQKLAVLISFLMSLPVIYNTVLTGIRETDPELLRMADSFGASPFKKIITVYIPSLRPQLLSAVSVAMGFAWKSGIAAEVIGMPKGAIGTELQQAKVYLNTTDLFAWTVVIVVLSLLTERIITAILSRATALLQ